MLQYAQDSFSTLVDSSDRTSINLRYPHNRMFGGEVTWQSHPKKRQLEEGDRQKRISQSPTMPKTISPKHPSRCEIFCCCTIGHQD
jgi:hypothetical protein